VFAGPLCFPSVADGLDRLSTNAAGQVSYELKHPFRDGTTHVLFTCEDFLARLAVQAPGHRRIDDRRLIGIIPRGEHGMIRQTASEPVLRCYSAVFELLVGRDFG
jgi:hypothetical protein